MNKQKRYEGKENGKAARARSQATRQKKRDELKKVRRSHEGRRRILGSAKFSKLFTVHSAKAPKRTGKVSDSDRPLELKGTPAGIFVRVYRESEAPQCVQGGVPRWSESDLNPAHKKRLTKEKVMTDANIEQLKREFGNEVVRIMTQTGNTTFDNVRRDFWKRGLSDPAMDEIVREKMLGK